MVATSQVSNRKMFTVKLMERHHLQAAHNLSQEVLNKNLMLNTILVSEVSLLIMLLEPAKLKQLLKSLVLIEATPPLLR